jgi:hypothetical protein
VGGSGGVQVGESGGRRERISDDGATSGTSPISFTTLIDKLLLELDPRAGLTAGTRAARGLFPADVQTWFKSHDRPLVNSSSPYKPRAICPELHPLSYEYYFTRPTSRYLAQLCQAKPLLMLGTPSVAAEIQAGTAVLVDSSPYVVERFPRAASTSRVLQINVADFDNKSEYESVLFDPPWYLPDFAHWLSIAARCVQAGGRIIFPLFGEGTRPTAVEERADILRAASALGAVQVDYNRVEYDVSLFEMRALRAAGVTVDRPWRLADLVVIQASKELRTPFPPQVDSLAAAASVWDTYRIECQLVKLRRSAPTASTRLIKPLRSVTNFAYDTVSGRDRRRENIDIWSSRNRVAQVSDRATVERILMQLAAEDLPLRERITRVRGNFGHAVDELFDLLELSS